MNNKNGGMTNTMTHLIREKRSLGQLSPQKMLYLLQQLRHIFEGSSWIRSILVMGENPAVCENLAQLWAEAGSLLPQLGYRSW